MPPLLSRASAAAINFSLEQTDHVARTLEAVRRYIELKGGWISFADFMRMALYEPGLGYYAIGTQKFGQRGDFITAPTLTPLFGRTLARAIWPVFAEAPMEIFELGAGNGALARDMLAALSDFGVSPRYTILEVSPDLRAVQEETLSVFLSHVRWISELPDVIDGVVIANEVLDAVPCERIEFHNDAPRQLGVRFESQRLMWSRRVVQSRAQPELHAALTRVPPIEDYRTEINIEAEALVRAVTSRMRNAVALWIDYGFPQAEYYHPQRNDGTLMCHVQHRAHSDPFFAPGVQDITAHVDFTAMAYAARNAGATQLAYVNQAQWLLESGLLEELALEGEPGSADYLTATNAINRLLSPAEMGELFKVLMVARGNVPPPRGFSNDQSFRL